MIHYAAKITNLVQKKAHLKEVMSILKKPLTLWRFVSIIGNISLARDMKTALQEAEDAEADGA